MAKATLPPLMPLRVQTSNILGWRRKRRKPVPTFSPRMVCTECGAIGADARPNWNEHAPPSLFGPGQFTDEILHSSECP
jgi:hypothetical protein